MTYYKKPIHIMLFIDILVDNNIYSQRFTRIYVVMFHKVFRSMVAYLVHISAKKSFDQKKNHIQKNHFNLLKLILTFKPTYQSYNNSNTVLLYF